VVGGSRKWIESELFKRFGGAGNGGR
jgi:hypothetical protein